MVVRERGWSLGNRQRVGDGTAAFIVGHSSVCQCPGANGGVATGSRGDADLLDQTSTTTYNTMSLSATTRYSSNSGLKPFRVDDDGHNLCIHDARLP